VNLDVEQIRAVRVEDPGAIERAAAARSRRAITGRMVLIAADHPARGALAARGKPQAMANRQDLLARLVTALERPGVDGVLGTPDIVEDLLLLGALEDKVVIGSMNRGGLAGSVFELDDRYTAYDARSLADLGLDGGKMLIRIALDDPGTVRTLEHTARAISELAASGLMALVEPFMSSWEDGKLVNDLSADEVIKSAGIASGLGATSRHTWLKLPVVDDMERVMLSTTLRPCCSAETRRGPTTRFSRAGRRLSAYPGFGVSWLVARSSTPRTTTSLRLSTSPPASSPEPEAPPGISPGSGCREPGRSRPAPPVTSRSDG